MVEKLTQDQTATLVDLMIKMQGDMSAEELKANHDKEMAMYADEASIAKVTETYTNLFNTCDVNQDGRLDVAEFLEFNKKSFEMGTAEGFTYGPWDDAVHTPIMKDMYDILNTLEDGEGVSFGLISAMEESVGVECKKKQGLM